MKASSQTNGTWSAVVWNMNEARSRRAEAWAVLDELGADIALLNEARVPKDGFSGGSRGGEQTVGLDGKKRDWATAIASPHEIVDLADDVRTRGTQRAPFVTARPGSWTVAEVIIPEVGRVTSIAIYGLLDERSDASVHRSLSDMTPLFEDGRYNNRMILGGDLNTWTGWAVGGARLARDQSVLERIEAFGFVDCLTLVVERDGRGPLEGCPCNLGEACRHTRTRFDRRYPEIPYQMDYLFASSALAKRLLTCETVSLDDSPSDHFPITATFAR